MTSHQITDEMLAEIESAAMESIDGCPTWYERDGSFMANAEDFDRKFFSVASPCTILALLAELAELKRDADRWKEAYMEWSDKTDWVQNTAEVKELGKHRADVILKRFEALKSELDTYKRRSSQPYDDADIDDSICFDAAMEQAK